MLVNSARLEAIVMELQNTIAQKVTIVLLQPTLVLDLVLNSLAQLVLSEPRLVLLQNQIVLFVLQEIIALKDQLVRFQLLPEQLSLILEPRTGKITCVLRDNIKIKWVNKLVILALI